MAQEAATARPTELSGDPACPKTTRRPSESSSAHTQKGSFAQRSPCRRSTRRWIGSHGVRPSGRSAAASAPGRTRQGRSPARSRTLGSADPRAKSPSSRVGKLVDPSSFPSSRSPSRERGSPRARAARSCAERPARRKAPVSEPAEVPTTSVAARGSNPVASARAERTPAWKAPPTTPPAPSTSPTRAAPTFAPLSRRSELPRSPSRSTR